MKYSLMMLSISRRIMKDSQPRGCQLSPQGKYIKANTERFSTAQPMSGTKN